MTKEETLTSFLIETQTRSYRLAYSVPRNREEALDAVSDDLSDVESRVYEDEDEEEDEEDGEVYQTTCPSCGEEIFFDETILEDGGVRCPDCGEKLEFDLDESEGCPNCCGACGSAGEDEDDDEE